MPIALSPFRFAVALALLVLLTSGHRFTNDFVFDDVHVLRDGDLVHNPARIGEVWTHHTMIASNLDPGVQQVDTYRPIPISSFMLDAAISGRNPIAFHLTNLLLHLGCVFGVFFIGRRFGFGDGPSFYGAAVFAVHPWAVEAHVWLNGRSDPLALIFALGAILLALRAEAGAHPVRSRIGATVALFLACLSKETILLAFPAMLIMPGPASESASEVSLRRRFVTRVAWLAPAALVYLAVRLTVLGGMRAGQDPELLRLAALQLPWLLVDGVREALVPSLPYLRSLRDEYATLAVWHAIAAAVAVGAVALAAWAVRKRWPILPFAVTWFLLPLVPVAVVSAVLWPGFGRYLYIPLAGVSWLLADIGARLRDRPRQRWRVGGAAAHILLLGAMAWLHTSQYKDSATLFGAARAARPDIAMGHGFLGLDLLRYGEPGEALEPLAEAVRIAPEEHRYRIAFARDLQRTGRQQAAAQVAEEGVRRFQGRPQEAPYHLVLVNALPRIDPSAAVGHLARCLDVWPGRPDCESALRHLLEDSPQASLYRRAAAELASEHPSLRGEAQRPQ